MKEFGKRSTLIKEEYTLMERKKSQDQNQGTGTAPCSYPC